jgi:hypothetical protein
MKLATMRHNHCVYIGWGGYAGGNLCFTGIGAVLGLVVNRPSIKGLFPGVPRLFHVVGGESSSVLVPFGLFPVFPACKEGKRLSGGNCADSEHREHWELLKLIA